MEVSLASEWDQPLEVSNNDAPFVTPGDVITRESGYMRGHGTYTSEDGEDSVLYASVAGVVKRVNKLMRVLPSRFPYTGEIGDVLVGRVVEVQQRRWKVDVNARLDAVLQLSSVNLPGGELRRRSSEDELSMRTYLCEGDLISAEVQTLYKDGPLSLHARSLKYGKLSRGTMIKVNPSLIKRQKTHFHTLPGGINVILGLNGYIWLSTGSLDAPKEIEEDPREDEDSKIEEERGFFAEAESGLFDANPRTVIARLRNVILALAANGVEIWDTSIVYGYKVSEPYKPKQLLKRDVMYDVAKQTQIRLEADS